MEHLNIRVNFNMADYTDLSFPQRDREILQDLGKQVAEIAARPIMAERAKLWKDHNALRDTRPVLLCDPENGWNEILPDTILQCRNSVARHWEMQLRKSIYWGDEMNDDYVVDGFFNLPHVYVKEPWAVGDKKAESIQSHQVSDGKAYHIDTILESYEEADLIKSDELLINYEATRRMLETAKEIFDGSLVSRINTVWFWSVGMTDEFTFMRGIENLMYDFYDEPEGIHKVMGIIFDATEKRLNFLEENGLLSLNNDNTYVGSGGLGLIDGELPAADFSGKVRTRDMWGLAESQNTVSVSPDMFEEFIFPYQKKIMERFGLSCYGCCEPMDLRIDILKRVSNLRRVSVSYWADKRIMSEKLGKDYIYSLKPTPADLAVPKMDEEALRKTMREYLQTARDNHVEIIMKDNHTLGGNPENLKNFVRIVRQEIENL